MRVIREVALPRTASGRAPLTVRLLEHLSPEGPGGFEVRAEDGAGNVTFFFRDPRPYLVRAEFETTVAELLGEHVGASAPCAAAG